MSSACYLDFFFRGVQSEISVNKGAGDLEKQLKMRKSANVLGVSPSSIKQGSRQSISQSVQGSRQSINQSVQQMGSRQSIDPSASGRQIDSPPEYQSPPATAVSRGRTPGRDSEDSENSLSDIQ